MKITKELKSRIRRRALKLSQLDYQRHVEQLERALRDGLSAHHVEDWSPPVITQPAEHRA